MLEAANPNQTTGEIKGSGTLTGLLGVEYLAVPTSSLS